MWRPHYHGWWASKLPKGRRAAPGLITGLVARLENDARLRVAAHPLPIPPPFPILPPLETIGEALVVTKDSDHETNAGLPLEVN